MFFFASPKLNPSPSSQSPSASGDALESSLDLMNEGLTHAFYRCMERRGEANVLSLCFETMEKVDVQREITPRLAICQAWMKEYMPTWYVMPSLLRFGIGHRTASDRISERRLCSDLPQPDPRWAQAWDEAFSSLSDEQLRQKRAAADYYLRHKEFKSAALVLAELLATHRQRMLIDPHPAAKHDDDMWSDLTLKYTQCLCQMRSQKDETVTELLAARQLLKIAKHHIKVEPNLWNNTPYLVSHLLGEDEHVPLHRLAVALDIWNACHAAFEGVAPAHMSAQYAGGQKKIRQALERASIVREGRCVSPALYDNIREAGTPLVTQGPAAVDQPPLELFDVPEDAKLFMNAVREGNTKQRALVIHGLPGTGKTALAEAMLHDLCSESASNVWVYRMDPNTVLSSGFSESVQNITRIVKSLTQEKNKDGSARKIIIKIDEVDRLQGKRYSDESAENKRITTCLFDAFDNSSSSFHNIYLVATTNLVNDIDPAMLRRYTFKAEMFYPTDVTYSNILSYYARNWADSCYRSLSADERDMLVWYCRGSSAGDVAQVLANEDIEEKEDVLAALVVLSRKSLCRDWERLGVEASVHGLNEIEFALDKYWLGKDLRRQARELLEQERDELGETKVEEMPRERDESQKECQEAIWAMGKRIIHNQQELEEALYGIC